MGHTIFIATVLLAGAYWLFAATRMLRAMRGVPRLSEVDAPEPAQWPTVSLIVPACNEAETIEAGVGSRLADDYPHLETVLVDDRSSDETGAIIDRLAARDSRVVPVHITQLPAGWLGKVHALHEGASRAHGDWLLFSDADVEFAPGTLRRIIAYCEARQIDHLAALPTFRCNGLFVDATIDAFLANLAASIDLASVADAKSRHAIGGGVFSIVRRSALERTKGFEWLRLEVMDDVSLGQMLKDSGARQSIVNARDFITLDWYRSLGEMMRGLEKNLFGALGRYRLSILLPLLVVSLLIAVGPFAGLLFGATWMRLVCAAYLLIGMAVQARFNVWNGRRALSAPFGWIGSLLIALFALRSGVLAVSRGGIVWRGTLYPTPLLRAHMRLRFP